MISNPHSWPSRSGKASFLIVSARTDRFGHGLALMIHADYPNSPKRQRYSGMIKPSQVATIIAGAILSACLFLLGLDPATAGPVAASSVAATPSSAAAEPAALPHMRAYLFRRARSNLLARDGSSGGRDRKCGDPGKCVRVHDLPPDRGKRHSRVSQGSRFDHPYRAFDGRVLCPEVFGNTAGREYPGQPRCHDRSASGQPARAAPNIERYLNIFLSKSVLGGSHIKPAQGYQSHFASFDLSEREEVSHFNIDEKDAFNQQFLAKIEKLATTPAKVDGVPAPLNYVVPPDADAIELWDSGMPVFARPGDTLQTIAGLYRVPL